MQSVLKEKAYFLPLPIASKDSGFPPPEVSASKVPTILKEFDPKGATSEAATLKLSWQPYHLCDTILSNSKLAERKKTCN